MFRSIVSTFVLSAVACLSVAGCGQPNAPATAEAPAASASGQKYLLAAAPAQAVGVKQVKASSKDGDAVTITGRIGGSPEPFEQGVAAFTLVDPALQFCPPDEGCPTPWDYCCVTNDVKDNMALVKVVDDAGTLVAEDARKLLGVKGLSQIVVEGATQRDAQGNLTVLAKKVYVKHQ